MSWGITESLVLEESWMHKRRGAYATEAHFTLPETSPFMTAINVPFQPKQFRSIKHIRVGTRVWYCQKVMLWPRCISPSVGNHPNILLREIDFFPLVCKFPKHSMDFWFCAWMTVEGNSSSLSLKSHIYCTNQSVAAKKSGSPTERDGLPQLFLSLFYHYYLKGRPNLQNLKQLFTNSETCFNKFNDITSVY